MVFATAGLRDIIMASIQFRYSGDRRDTTRRLFADRSGYITAGEAIENWRSLFEAFSRHR